jgi:3-oxoacyl-[acyl-carrier protein] reductase
MSDTEARPRLNGRVAIVTGGARGIGAACVERLARDGASVVFSYRRHEPVAKALAERLTADGTPAVAMRSDVAQAADCDALVGAAVDRFGRLDILVNNAAETDTHRPWTEISEADWDHVMAVNAKGPFLMVRAAYPHLAASPAGRIVNIGSVTFRLGQAGLLHYVSSKGALIGFTRSLARELGPSGITVNTVEPGAIRTEMELDLFGDRDEETGRVMATKQSIRRRGVAADVAGAVAFFASDDAGFITGQSLLVDGGWAMS